MLEIMFLGHFIVAVLILVIDIAMKSQVCSSSRPQLLLFNLLFASLLFSSLPLPLPLSSAEQPSSAEQSAMQSEQPRSAEQPAMQCSKCDNILCQIEQCCFYNKTPTEVHLILRPELPNMPSSMFLSNICEGRTIDVKCSACTCKVGRQLPFGPRGTHFVAFGNEKVYVFGNRLHKKATWSQLQHESPYSTLPRRTSTNFTKNIVVTPPSQVATSTSSHSTRSPPAVLDNLPKPSHACVGDVLVACESTSTTEEGYLKLRIGDKCQVLYVGSQANQDDAWYFAESIHSKSRGWIAKAVVLNNLPKQSEACLGDIVVACVDAAAVAEGYLEIRLGETFEVLHVGSRATQDDGWYFAASRQRNDRGWVAKTSVVLHSPTTSVLPDSSIPPQTILLSQNDIARLAATTDTSLHELARSTIDSIDSLQSQDSTPHNLDDYFTWKKYIAQHKHARDIIGDGITAATCERVVNEFDYNRNNRERVDLIFYRKDGTYCRLHPGKITARDAKPKIGVVQPDSISGFKADTNERVLYS